MKCTIKDFKKVHRILSHESVYPYIVDDYCPEKPPNSFGLDFLQNEDIKVLMPNNDSIFICIPITRTIYNVHSGILPSGRGKSGILGAKEAIDWMFNNTYCQVMIGITPTQNRAAMIFNRLIKFKLVTILRKSQLYNNELQDQGLFILHKGENQWV